MPRNTPLVRAQEIPFTAKKWRPRLEEASAIFHKRSRIGKLTRHFKDLAKITQRVCNGFMMRRFEGFGKKQPPEALNSLGGRPLGELDIFSYELIGFKKRTQR